jgi:anti-sigma regulatory factor (Ser/Thr protein kinase)
MPERSLSLTIKPDIREIPGISSMLESVMRDHGFLNEDILDTQLAVEEAVTNIIAHGYGEDTRGEIVVSCRADRDLVEIRIEDRALPFNPLAFPEPELTDDLEERKIGGLGIFLIRHVMDETAYHFEDGKNILVLVKKNRV